MIEYLSSDKMVHFWWNDESHFFKSQEYNTDYGVTKRGGGGKGGLLSWCHAEVLQHEQTCWDNMRRHPSGTWTGQTAYQLTTHSWQLTNAGVGTKATAELINWYVGK